MAEMCDYGVRAERTDGEVQLICDAVNHVAHQMVMINALNLNGNGIEYGRPFFVVNGNNGIALL